MRINPKKINTDDLIPEENVLQERLAMLIAFGGTFGFFVKILFL